MTTLYHGTTRENAEQIKSCGILLGPVYFSASFEQAAEYALANDPDGVVITVEFNGALSADNESCEWESAEDAIENGAEVYTDSDIFVTDVKYTHHEDYEIIN